MPNIVPKSVQTCFEDVLRWFFRKTFLPSVPWRVESSKFFKKIKKFQNSNNAQNRSQKCPNVFWRCFRVIFSKKFFAQCSMEGRVFENFQKNQKSFEVPKMPKIVPKSAQTIIFKIKKKFEIPKKPKIVLKSVQTSFEHVLRWFFRKKNLPSVPWGVESSKIFQKIKKFSNFQKCPKSYPKVSKRVLKMF